ncbi:MAG: response regulator, partial [Verrucomicrobiota bacterium]
RNSQTSTISEQATISRRLGKKKALVADDDPHINKMVSKMLSSDDWEVITATTVDEAVEKIDQDVSIAFVDVHMPGPGPLEALRLLNEKVPSTRLVSFSGDYDQNLPEIVIRGGASEFLHKPVNRVDFIEQANRAIVDNEALGMSN